MLYRFPRISSHKAYRLNRNIIYFFSKIRTVSAQGSIQPLTNYFDVEFANFLGLAKQATLLGHFEVFFNTFKGLTNPEKDSVIEKFSSAQKINAILSDATINGNSIKLTSLPQPIRDPTAILFSYLYTYTLGSFGKLKSHYKSIFDSLDTNICPFCGIEFLNEPSIIRQDYDHMLMLSHYAFCGVNMDNLVPTGIECNRISKHSVDAIYDNGTRVVFNSAYVAQYDLRISLQGSTPPAGLNNVGVWNISISPNNDYTREWARVYNIHDRYTNNVLKKFYIAWLKEFREYLFIKSLLPIAENTLLDELTASGIVMKENPTLSLQNIVKGALYEFVATYNDAAYRTAILNFFNSR